MLVVRGAQLDVGGKSAESVCDSSEWAGCDAVKAWVIEWRSASEARRTQLALPVVYPHVPAAEGGGAAAAEGAAAEVQSGSASDGVSLAGVVQAAVSAVSDRWSALGHGEACLVGGVRGGVAAAEVCARRAEAAELRVEVAALQSQVAEDAATITGLRTAAKGQRWAAIDLDAQLAAQVQRAEAAEARDAEANRARDAAVVEAEHEAEAHAALEKQMAKFMALASAGADVMNEVRGAKRRRLEGGGGGGE